MTKKSITVRLNEGDYEIISAHAKKLGMGVGTYLRMKGLQHE